MCVIFPCWGSVQQSSHCWTAYASFGVFEKQQVILLSGKPFSGHLIPIMDRYAHQANSVSIYQPFVISVDRAFLGKSTRIPILPQFGKVTH